MEEERYVVVTGKNTPKGAKALLSHPAISLFLRSSLPLGTGFSPNFRDQFKLRIFK
jgi:hypothetical protein